MIVVTLHPKADEELVAAAVHYVAHASRKVAEDFLSEFDRAVTLLQEHPGLRTPWHGKVRRFPFRRFPYSIAYDETAGRRRIVAIAHQHRRPGYWRDRS